MRQNIIHRKKKKETKREEKDFRKSSFPPPLPQYLMSTRKRMRMRMEGICF